MKNKFVSPYVTDDPTSLSLEVLVKNFSFFQLHELTQSIISDLKAYYARSIMKEEAAPSPALEKIKFWERQSEKLSLIQRDSQNFSSREKMEAIILEFAPQLSSAE